ncbi:hypothetical protein LTR66_013768 [Elasticomyces elasticus]|nr:hypothetical protein LTR66_013768 [Elasticomyces elasticus]
MERAAFATDSTHLNSLLSSLCHVENLGDNDIYRWYMASVRHSTSADQTEPTDEQAAAPPPDLKLNLIYPCTPKHIKKYSSQAARMVTEPPSLYHNHIRPLMQRHRADGRLDWVYNIIEGRTEQEDVLHRSAAASTPPAERFLLLPDLNWDRKTLSSLHLLALVERRDLWSLRDLAKRHVPWLRAMRRRIVEVVSELEFGMGRVEADMLKLYVHYQPTYYHFHIHIVHVSLEAGATQAVGKAFGLANIISQLETMAGGEDAGMADVELSYTLGEASDLWTEIFLPLKEGRALDAS